MKAIAKKIQYYPIIFLGLILVIIAQSLQLRSFRGDMADESASRTIDLRVLDSATNQRKSSAPKAASTTSSPPPPLPSLVGAVGLKAMAEAYPLFGKYRERVTTRAILETYGENLKRLELDDYELASFRELITNLAESGIDAESILAKKGILPGTKESQNAIKSVRRDAQEELAAFLGPSKYQEFLKLSGITAYENKLKNSMQIDFTAIGEPLNDELAWDVAVLMENILGDPGDLPAVLARIEQSGTINNPTLSQSEKDFLSAASEILTETQVDVIRERFIEEKVMRHAEEISNRNRRNSSGGG